METLVINTGELGINEYQDMAQPLVRFIQDNANALKEGAKRTKLVRTGGISAELKYGGSYTIISVCCLGQHTPSLSTVFNLSGNSTPIVSRLGGCDLSSETLITPTDIKRAVSHLQGLLDAYSADIKADFKIEVHYTQTI